jgi:ubiE/COQ5 methyltransferase family
MSVIAPELVSHVYSLALAGGLRMSVSSRDRAHAERHFVPVLTATMHRVTRQLSVLHRRHSNHNTTTHFGYKEVPTSAKESLVKGVFSSVASSYDMMNDAMSLGVHRLWKDDFIANLNPGNPKLGVQTRCIDVAGGTGDIALRILDCAREEHADRDIRVDVVDINPEMLEEGRKRFRRTMYHNSASFCQSSGLFHSSSGYP